MEIVPNEWLPEYLLPNAGKRERSIADRFVDDWGNGVYKVVLRQKSPLISKFLKYWKQSETVLEFAARFKRVHLLMRDSSKTILVDESDVKQLPQEIQNRSHSKDRYLLELAYSGADRTIVTTDRNLKESLSKACGVSVCLLEEFLRDHCKN
ncbi:MAG: hypothetical protein KAT11_05040 [Phycisphaerae bacterium]|nr:hypothetical protein [Phycisphaerae bacterium]